MASTDDRRDWRAIRKERKKNKLEQVEQYLESKKVIESQDDGSRTQSRRQSSSLAVAIAGSIVDNVQTDELATYLGGQIARAAAIYQVDEVVIFDDSGSMTASGASGDGALSRTWQNCLWLAKVLQYLECPQYLRKYIFPLSNDLRSVGLLNPLDTPHHLRSNSVSLYREGVVVDEVHEQLKQSYVNVGLTDFIRIDKQLEPGQRVTVKLSTNGGNRGMVVPSREPHQTLGTYWGYEVRLAKNLSSVFTESQHKRGYNLTIGTSDKGKALNEVIFSYKKRRRALIVIGGLQGLEHALANDKVLKTDDVSLVFDHYVNVCPSQGSRTIRSEEALLISLALITDKLNDPVYS